MAELSKISRSVKKASPEASLETLLVLDAITGQNAISQAKEFCKAADATGIILTKAGRHRQGRLRGGGQAASGPAGALHRRGRGHRRPAALHPGGLLEELLPRQWNPPPRTCGGEELSQLR